MSSDALICPACGRSNPGSARTCGNCATLLSAPVNGEPAMTDAERRRLAEQETIYAAELGTVQTGAWADVSTKRKPGEMPLPPQVQAEALRREREEANRRAVEARMAKERAEHEARRAALERQRAEIEAQRTRFEAMRPQSRVCQNCGTPAPTTGTAYGQPFTFCLNCGASFTESSVTGLVPPPVLPIATVTSPVGVLQQQARREVQQGMQPPPIQGQRYAIARDGSVGVPSGGGTMAAEQPRILPVTEATPYIAALLSFLLPGVGQLRNAQWGKGFAIILATFALLSLLPIGLWSVTAFILRALIALDAFRIAQRRRRGETITPWQWDCSFIV